ncbi:MAG: nucleotidyltransferase family protein [Shewanella sp.]|nr:nucleotidyltransferase family protein [Shewanella sp.]
MKAMILAAGRGARLAPLTDTKPKPLVEVNGKPLIVYHIERLAAAGFKQIVINTAWLGEMLPQALGDGRRWNIELVYSNETEALETGGGIKKALSILGDSSFFVINGDVYIDALPASIKDITLNQNQLAHLWLVKNPDHNINGDFSLKGNKISNTGENKYTFAGIGLYHPDLFANAPDGKFGLPQILRPAIDDDKVNGELLSGTWCDVGTVQRLQDLNQLIIDRLKDQSITKR